MRGVDISLYTAKIDYLFLDHDVSIGIGDGGNEIGMGILYDEIKTIPSLVTDPAKTKTTKLLIASVSNWGVYGLVVALSEMINENLLPQKYPGQGLPAKGLAGCLMQSKILCKVIEKSATI